MKDATEAMSNAQPASAAEPTAQPAAVPVAIPSSESGGQRALISVTVPSSLWAGKPCGVAFKNLQGKYPEEVIAHILVEKMGCTKAVAGRFFGFQAIKKGDEKDAGTYHVEIDDLLEKLASRYTLSIDS